MLITVKIKGDEEVTLTYEEAQALYNELEKVFGHTWYKPFTDARGYWYSEANIPSQ